MLRAVCAVGCRLTPYHVRRPTVYRPLLSYDEPVVYVYDSPSARQTIIGTYHQLPPQPSVAARARLNLWSRYFGGGMSSLMFQDIREFRSLAYYAYGDALREALWFAFPSENK